MASERKDWSANKWLQGIVNVAALVFLGFVLLRPGGLAQQQWSTFMENRARAALIDTHWDAIAGGAPREGVVLVAFVDYQCPVCRSQHGVLVELKSRHEDVRIVYRHFPLTIHPNARVAALASICGQEQGAEEKMHEALFDSRSWVTTGKFDEIVRSLGLDGGRFESCLSSDEANKRVDADLQIVRTLGLHATRVLSRRKRVITD